MNTKFQRIVTLLALLTVLTLAGCSGFGDPLDDKDREKIDEQIREAIEETFPLPEQVIIRTHIGDDLRFSTDLSVEEVVEFYRDAYTQKGYEAGDGQVSDDNATVRFQKDGEKVVSLEVTEHEKGSDVHIQLLSSPP